MPKETAQVRNESWKEVVFVPSIQKLRSTPPFLQKPLDQKASKSFSARHLPSKTIQENLRRETCLRSVRTEAAKTRKEPEMKTNPSTRVRRERTIGQRWSRLSEIRDKSTVYSSIAGVCLGAIGLLGRPAADPSRACPSRRRRARRS